MELDLDASLRRFCDDDDADDAARDAELAAVQAAILRRALRPSDLLARLEARLDATAADDAARGRAVLLLARALECPEGLLAELDGATARAAAARLCARLDDRLSTLAALRALKGLARAHGAPLGA